jgi:hypothetical protein
MPFEVFISHSTKDKVIAEEICRHLESRGIGCWIAPRDIEFGADWSEGITKGISACRVFVLVFSDSANQSDHVRREVAKAFSLGLSVIPFRIQPVNPSASLGYFLETVHWLDAIDPSPQEHFGHLADQVERSLGDRGEVSNSRKEPISSFGSHAIASAEPAPTQKPASEVEARPKAKAGWRRILAFNVVLVPAAILAVAIIAVLAQQQLQSLGEKEVVENAKIMIETARASRHYTTEQIAPLLDKQQETLTQFEEAVRTIVANSKKQGSHQVQTVPSAAKGVLGVSDSGELVLPRAEFHPQSIPFYAATEAFNYFRHKYPEFGYKEAALNPTNLRDRAVDWEADVIGEFQKNESETELIGHRSTPIGPSLFISAPIKVDDQSCLDCHSTVERAPAGMVKLYGSSNGFGWKMGDIVGAQIVSVPATLTQRLAADALRNILLITIAAVAALVIVANVAFIWLRKPSVS